jgi:hypothetical protein
MNLRTKLILSLCLAAVLLTATSLVLAANPAMMERWVGGSGGGVSSGGKMTLSGTLGQSMSGVSSGGTVSLSAGYWRELFTNRVYLPVLGKQGS